MPRGVPNTPKVGAQAEEATFGDEQDLAPRAEQTRRERRNRNPGDLDRMYSHNLVIPRDVQEKLDKEGKVCRWIRDNDNRIAGMNRLDWDVVDGVSPVPASKDGTEGKMILVSKFRDWWEEDQKAKARVLDRTDKSMERGKGGDQSVPSSEYNENLVQQNRISRKPRG